MDLVRYAETKAFESDYTMPYVYRYRDYLIRAFNCDVPYDQFVRDHIAGDLLQQPRCNPVDGAVNLREFYDMGRKERKRLGGLGKKYLRENQ